MRESFSARRMKGSHRLRVMGCTSCRNMLSWYIADANHGCNRLFAHASHDFIGRVAQREANRRAYSSEEGDNALNIVDVGVVQKEHRRHGFRERGPAAQRIKAMKLSVGPRLEFVKVFAAAEKF